MEQLKHECGVAMIRLLKPLEYYEKKYGTWMYGLNKLYLLMEKQHNRGQEGAGLACVKLEANPGEEYMFRERALGSGAITEIFENIQNNFKDLTPEQLHDAEYAKRTLPFAGEIYMGHLRYSTTGKSGISYVHPFLRRNNWRAKNLALCGNFNMTNVDEIFARITAIGQHPRKYADTYIMLEQVGHRLDREVERVFNLAEAEGLTGMGITHYIEEYIDLANVLRTSSREWDGGYVICGLTGSGESFAIRDPWGIRPAFWYQDDEIAVLASERPVIQTALNVPFEEIKELQPGQALLISKEGKIRTSQINKPRENHACSFERIYFSRGSDVDIYKERKRLGEKLVPRILKAINNDIDHTVFSFIPNTAEVAFYGMLQGLDDYLNEEKVRQIAALGHTEYLCITDCGLPIPSGVTVVDISLTAGIPSFMDVLEAVNTELVTESYILAEEIHCSNQQTESKIKLLLDDLPSRSVPHEEFKQLVGRCKCVIRTGETSPYANIILVGGVNF